MGSVSSKVRGTVSKVSKSLDTITFERNYDEHVETCKLGCRREEIKIDHPITLRLPDISCSRGGELLRTILRSKGFDATVAQMATGDASPI